MNKTLTKQNLHNILSSRFDAPDKRLSEIASPALLQDATKSAKRVAQAIKKGEKITVVGDYDVDGVTSSAIMVDFFREIPYPIDVVIPNRFRDGYGVSASVLEKIDANLIITVDNGITAIEASEICKQRGIDLIITDHHTPSDTLPDAYSIVDPKLSTCSYPFKEICGAEVAWLVLALVKKELGLKIDMKAFLDILAIGIIADIMPLVDINRTLVKEGLKLLLTSNRPSSIIIRDFLGKSVITSQDIAFMIAPRINSAGRLKDASIALDFFTAKSTNEAYQQFEILNSLNEERKATESETTKEAISCVDEEDKIVVVAGEDWHEGVVGIVASRLVEKFSKPAIVLSIKDGVAKGSARSIGDVSIYDLIKANEQLLTKFGGHKMAAGLSLHVENLEEFRVAVNTTASTIDRAKFIPKESSLGSLHVEDIDLELLKIIEEFEPYGEANPAPTFLIKDAEVISVKLMGSDKSHSRITIRQNPTDTKTMELIAFRVVYDIPADKRISCRYSLSKNEYNGRVSTQLLVSKIL